MDSKNKQVNNAFYDELNHMWEGSKNHPIALLKAENKIRNPWISKTIDEHGFTKADILDIGCGGGLLTNPLALKGHKVVGIDLSASSLEWAKKQDSTSTAKYLQANAEKLPFAAESFDVVCAMDLLEHVPNPQSVINEAARVLKPNGLFFFHTFNKTWMSYLLIIKAVELFVKNTPKDMHLYSHFIKPKDLKTWCKKNSLEIDFLQGLIPDIRRLAFWKTAFTREIDEDFTFTFTKSFATGYVGYARKKITPYFDK